MMPNVRGCLRTSPWPFSPARKGQVAATFAAAQTPSREPQQFNLEATNDRDEVQ